MISIILLAVGKFIKYGVISTAALVALAISTKPSLDSFDSYIKQCQKNKIYDTPESENNPLVNLAVGVAALTTKQKSLDYVLFRTMCTKNGGVEQYFIGAFNTWIMGHH